VIFGKKVIGLYINTWRSA